MKKTLVPALLVLPLLVAGCSKKGSEKPSFAVPIVDVDKLVINLPTMPTLPTDSVKTVGEYDYIDLYELSDMHAMIDRHVDTDSEKAYFGFDGLANFIKAKRQDNPGTLLLSSGDMWQGGAESNLTQGKIVAESMRYCGFEAMTLGNHEFDWGKSILSRNSAYFKNDMPLLCGNLKYKEGGQRPDFVVPSKVVTRGAYKVGVIGTIGSTIEDSIAKSVFNEFELSSSYTFAQTEAARLKSEEHCNVVVWCSHEDTETVSAPNGVDVFFGGHEHKDVNTTKSNGSSIPAPAMATRNYSKDIAHVELKFNHSSNELVSATGELINASDSSAYLVEESNIKSIFDQYRVETDKAKQYQLSNVSGKFVANAELANLSTKAMFEEYKDENTICAFQNGSGGVRSDIEAGMVTYGSVYQAFPFDNEIVKFEIKGSDIPRLFEEKARNLNVYCTAKKFSEYDSSKTYNIVTTDFVCTNYLKYEESQFTRFAGTVIRDCVAKFIYNNSGLDAKNFSSALSDFTRPRY